MEDSLSITKDIGEYYIYLKDNSNLIAKGYEKSLIKRVAIETTKRYLNELYLPMKSIYKMVKVGLEVQFKISVMKISLKIKSIRLRFLMFEKKC